MIKNKWQPGTQVLKVFHEEDFSPYNSHRQYMLTRQCDIQYLDRFCNANANFSRLIADQAILDAQEKSKQ